jgi:Phage tail lysozyme
VPAPSLLSTYPYAETIWNGLLAKGATPIQAAGMMGNMVQESSLNPENDAIDINGSRSIGIVSWNQAPGVYHNAAELLTGNPTVDITNQIAALEGVFSAASGPDPATAASNFMNNFEHCAPAYCNESRRRLMAEAVYQAAQSGNWTLTPGTPPAVSAVPVTPGAPVAPNPSTAGFFGQGILSQGLQGVEQYLGLSGPVQNALGLKNPVSWAEAASGEIVAVGQFLISAETWIRLGEVLLGVILASAGVAMIAVTLAQSNPSAVGTIASLIPGVGPVEKGAAVAAGTLGGRRQPSSSSAPNRRQRRQAVADDDLFEQTRGSGRANRRNYRTFMDDDTSDLRRRTA